MTGLRALVLAAGKGTRMVSDLPKVLHTLSGQTVIEHILETLRELKIVNPWLVIGYRRELIKDKLKGRAKWVYQKEQKGTGHAVLSAGKAFRGFRGNLLVLAGDVPLIQMATLRRFIKEHSREKNVCSCLTVMVENPSGYGRILRGPENHFIGIREELEATTEEKKIREINSGIYLFSYPRLAKVLKQIKPSPKKKEIYLTDAVELLAESGEKVAAYPFAQAWETQGINSQNDFSRLEEMMNISNINVLQSQGVTVTLPSQTYIQKGVKVGRGTVIYPFVWIERGVQIGTNCTIGPFAKIRSGSVIRSGALIGSFVEIVRSQIGEKTTIKHLSYFGDAEVGKNVNVGAGTITANYDGKQKNKTRIGDHVSLGIHTALVAPVTLKEKVKTGAGSVVLAKQTVAKKKTIAGVPAKEIGKGK